ncbi:zinc finger domain-containing protein [Streptomyces sp. NPDC001135]
MEPLLFHAVEPKEVLTNTGELSVRARAWFRRLECPACSAGVGHACRSASGYPTDHHRARRDAAGPPPYEEWRKQGLIPERPRPSHAILEAGCAARQEFRIDQSLGDAIALVRRFLADGLSLLMDEAVMDRIDDDVRTLLLARGPEGSAEVVTVLACQLATFLMLSAPDGDPDALYSDWIRSQIESARDFQRAKQGLRPQES